MGRITDTTLATDDPLARLLYLLARDHLPTGTIEAILKEHFDGRPQRVTMSSGMLLQLAESWAERVRNPSSLAQSAGTVQVVRDGQ